MLNISNKTILVVDLSGSFTHVAERLARDFGRVKYFTQWMTGFSQSKDFLPGLGLPDVERIADIYDAYDHIDMAMFTDVGWGGLQEHMRKDGLPVFGSGAAQVLEIDRLKLKESLIKIGLATAKSRVVQGLDTLRKTLSKEKDLYVKFSFFRGDGETFHHKEWFSTEPWFNNLALTLGPYGREAEFLLEEPIEGDAVEVGYDTYAVDGRMPQGTLWGYEIKDCYDAETEILTDRGWKYFKDLSGGERVLTLNASDPRHYRIEYQQPTRYVRSLYNGPMLQIQNRAIDLLVTPNHNLWMQVNSQDVRKKLVTWKTVNGPEFTFYQATHDRKLVRASEIDLSKPFSMPFPRSAFFHAHTDDRIQVFEFDDARFSSRQLARLLGLYLSEGSSRENRNEITISQFKYVDEFEKILATLPVKFKRFRSGFYLNHRALAKYFRQFGKAGDKFVPQWLKDSSYVVIKEFLDCYCLGDGSVRPNERNGRSRIYTTKSKRMADDLQELLLKSGSPAIVTKHKGRSIYAVSERVVNTKHYVLPGQAKWAQYDGEIFCVTVPNHIIMVRRNGKPVWSGNSGYIGTTDTLPQRLRDNANQFGQILEQYGYTGILSTEVRVTEEENYLIDFTARCPSPPSEVECAIIENYSDIVWEGAHGRLIEPEFAATYGAMLVLKSDWIVEHPLALKLEPSNGIYLHGHFKIEGKDFAVVPEEFAEFGGAVGIGDSVESAIEGAFESAHAVSGYQVRYDGDAFEQAIKTIREGEELGLTWHPTTVPQTQAA